MAGPRRERSGLPAGSCSCSATSAPPGQGAAALLGRRGRPRGVPCGACCSACRAGRPPRRAGARRDRRRPGAVPDPDRPAVLRRHRAGDQGLRPRAGRRRPVRLQPLPAPGPAPLGALLAPRLGLGPRAYDRHRQAGKAHYAALRRSPTAGWRSSTTCSPPGSATTRPSTSGTGRGPPRRGLTAGRRPEARSDESARERTPTASADLASPAMAQPASSAADRLGRRRSGAKGRTRSLDAPFARRRRPRAAKLVGEAGCSRASATACATGSAAARLCAREGGVPQGARGRGPRPGVRARAPCRAPPAPVRSPAAAVSRRAARAGAPRVRPRPPVPRGPRDALGVAGPVLEESPSANRSAAWSVPPPRGPARPDRGGRSR